MPKTRTWSLHVDLYNDGMISLAMIERRYENGVEKGASLVRKKWPDNENVVADISGYLANLIAVVRAEDARQSHPSSGRTVHLA